MIKVHKYMQSHSLWLHESFGITCQVKHILLLLQKLHLRHACNVPNVMNVP